MLGNNQQKLDVTSSLAYTNNHVSQVVDMLETCDCDVHPNYTSNQKIDILSTIWPCKAGTSLEEDKTKMQLNHLKL
jgi:hypothetical protein